MKLRAFTVTGALAIGLGLLALLHPEFKGPVNKQQVELGDTTTTVETQRVFRVPRYLSGILIVAGALLVAGAQMPGPEDEGRKKRSSGRRRG